MLFSLELFFIVFAGYLLFMCSIIYLIVKNKNKNQIIQSRFAKLYLEGQILSISVAPVSVFLLSIFFKFGIIGFMVVSSFLMVLLFLVTSPTFINFLFNLDQRLVELSEVFNEFLSYVSTIKLNNFNSNLTAASHSFLRSMRSHSQCLGRNNSMSCRFYTSTINQNPEESGSSSASPIRSHPYSDVSLSEVKNINKVLSGGYLGYKNIYSICSLIEMSSIDNLQMKVSELFDKLLDDKTYTFWVVLRYYDSISGDYRGITTGSSVKIRKGMDAKLLALRVQRDVFTAEMKYGFEDDDGELVLLYREWLSSDDFKSSKDILVQRMNESVASPRRYS